MWSARRARLKPRLGLAPLKRGIAPHRVRAGLPARGRAASSLAHKPRGGAPGFTVAKGRYVVRAECSARPRPAEAGYRTAPGQGRFTGQRPSREFTRAQRATKGWYVVRAQSGCTLRVANPGRKPGAQRAQARGPTAPETT